jgi:hemerythrin-like domain-containing protein
VDEKTEPFRDEHVCFREHLERILAAARDLPSLPPGERRAVVRRALAFVHDELTPHAEAEEATIYREVGRILGHPWATAPMVYDHMLIRRRAIELEQADPDDCALLQRHLYGLHALVCSHFEKEEQLYLPLLEREGEEEIARIYDRLVDIEHAFGRPFLAG